MFFYIFFVNYIICSTFVTFFAEDASSVYYVLNNTQKRK